MRKGIKPRGRWEIIHDILKETAKEEKMGGGKAKKTRIMQGAYLDWRNFQRHFEYLLDKGFIGCLEGEDCYYLADEGITLLERLREVNTILKRPVTPAAKNSFGRQI